MKECFIVGLKKQVGDTIMAEQDFIPMEHSGYSVAAFLTDVYFPCFWGRESTLGSFRCETGLYSHLALRGVACTALLIHVTHSVSRICDILGYYCSTLV